MLARERQYDLVIMDELMGRRYARQMNMNITGTLGVLLKSKEREFISEITPLLKELVAKGTWLNPKLIAKAIEIAGE
jgi:predicted nucleic acid-binding protein